MAAAPFFAVAMRSPGRQRSFRAAVVAHLVFVGVVALACVRRAEFAPIAAQLLIVAAIVEGALLLGWRWTQIPRSPALEFLLVSPVQPERVFYSEALAGVGRLALVGVAGVPVLGVLVVAGRIHPDDLVILTFVPLVWALLCGLAVTAWAYESTAFRRGLEVIGIAGVVLYLIVGVLAGERLPLWLAQLPEAPRWWIMEAFRWLHVANPFALIRDWFAPHRSDLIVLERLAGLTLAAGGLAGLLAMRCAKRLRGHFQDRHYRPQVDRRARKRAGPGDWPLSWWAVRRVMEYSGRINLWLAGGFGVLYATYTIAGESWPSWIGRTVFQMVDSAGGIPVVVAGLAVLAAVPASYQYGLWDSSVPERCRRLELLLTTRIEGVDYWHASAAAAWRRGRGYALIAGLLIAAGVLARQFSIGAALVALAAGTALWFLYFALGFLAFARGGQAGGLGLLLTLGLPSAAVVASQLGAPALAALTPPGAAYSALSTGPSPTVLGSVAAASAAAWIAGTMAQSRCDRWLRRWYDRHHGQAAAE